MHTFFMFKFIVKVCHIVSLFIFSSFAIVLMSIWHVLSRVHTRHGMVLG